MPNPKLETYKNKATNTVYDLTDADAQGKLTAILDGEDIDSFGDVENALDGKVDEIAGKGLSTNDYDNTAKGIVDNIQSNVIANTKLIKDTVGWSGKNKLEPVPYKKVTISGIEWTLNTDGTVTANGTATALSMIAICERYGNTGNKRVFPNGRYIINGAISADYYIQCGRTYNNAYSQIGEQDTGNGSLLVLNGDDGSANEVTLQIICAVKNGKTANNVLFKPMVRDADILDPTYEPYAGTTAFPRSEQAVLGAKNLLPYPYYQTTRTENGITFTDNGDGTVTANGTSTAITWFSMIAKSYADTSKIFKKGQTYILNGCPKGGSNETYRVRFNCNPYSNIHDDYGDGVEFTYPDDNTLTQVYIMIGISSGVTVNNLVFKPMIRLATDPDPTYVSYATTNRELTEKVTPVPLELTAGTNVDFNSNNKSCILGELKLIRTQIHITSALANGNLLLSANVKFVGFGSALLVNTNNGQVYGLFVTAENNILKIMVKGTIPEGYYALDYCYV